MSEIRFVDLQRQYASIKDEVNDAVLAAIASTSYILGEDVRLFEREWADFCSVSDCVGVGSGTAALELAYEAIGLEPGDEVLAPANTFIATVAPLVRLGVRPVLIDCDEYGQIDVEAAAAAVTGATKAIVGVHLFGHPCDAAAVTDLCQQHELVFVEDAAQAHGAEYRGRRCGSLGRIAAFSFYPGKNLGAYGDAGAVVTNDAELADRIRVLRDLGQRRKYEHIAIGPNERLDTVQAAVLRVKLRHLETWNDARREHAAAYGALLAHVELPPVADWALPSWHLYVVRTDLRDRLHAVLGDAGIATGMHYPVPLHLQPALAQLGYEKGDFPRAEAWAEQGLSLPMFPELQPSEIERVAEAVSRVVTTAPV